MDMGQKAKSAEGELHPLDDVTAVTEQRPLNGEEAQMGHERFAMRADSTTPN